MKRFFLLSLVAMLGICLKAATVDLVVWEDKAEKKGCKSLFDWSKNNNKGVDNGDGAYRIHTERKADITNGTITFENYELLVNGSAGVQVMKDELFCLYINDNNTVTWPHYSANTFPAQTDWFSEGGNTDMKFGETFFVTKINIYRNASNGQLCIRFNSDEAPEFPVVGTGTSPYVLQVWDYRTAQTDEGTSAPRWDTSGGLFRVWEGIEGVKDGERYPIDPKYLRSETIDGYTYKWLCFHKVENIAQEAAAAGHPLMWATTDYDQYKAIVGDDKGFAQVADPNSELYVIDFSVPGYNDGKGIYIEVPSLEDIKDGGWDTGNENANSGLRRFFRGGIRFEFADLREPFTGDNYWANALRYVKWGHVFRLNEVARPLNAFPVFGTGRNNEPSAGNPRVLIGWQDDFGPCEWNGYDYTPLPEGSANYDKDFGVSGKSHVISQTDDTKSDYVSMRAKKRGDSRLVAEYPFWLRKIYLQVVQDPEATLDNGAPDTRYKRFYLSFEGEYDLSAAIKSEAQWSYIPPENENSISATPNVFHGEKVAFNEPAFSRFYNLDLTNITEGEYKGDDGKFYQDFLPLLGCRLEDYLTRIGHADLMTTYTLEQFKKGEVTIPDSERGHYLYMMEYHKGYDAHSQYSLLNAAGDKLTYHDVPDVKLGAEYSYTAKEGKYYNAADNAVLGTSPGLVANTKFVQSEKVSMYFDPENAGFTPTHVDADYEFNFPNQIQEYIAGGKFSIQYNPYDFSDAITLTGEANWRNKNGEGIGRYGSTVDWSTFTSHTPQTSETAPGRFPVANYAVAYAHGTDSKAPALSEFTAVELNGTTLDADADPRWWLDNPEKKNMRIHNHIVETSEWIQDYYVHYHLDAWYNRAYMQGGVFSDKVFEAVPEVYSETKGTAPAAAPAAALKDSKEIATVTIPATDSRNAVTYQIRPVTLHGNFSVKFDGQTTPVSEVSADTAADAPAEYYTLQGIRVDAPVPGTVCIVRRGTAVTKELIR
jgi:hypothetical protein